MIDDRVFGRLETGLIKYILFSSFWSFLLALAGVLDILIGLLVLGDVITVKNGSTVSVAVVCFGVGGLYLIGGIVVALMKRRREGD